MKISIVIPSPVDEKGGSKKGNYELLSKCLSSLVKYKNPEIEYELIVIGNDWSGFEKNVNKGLSLATGDFVWLINDDAELLGPGADRVMLEEFKDERVGLVGMTGYKNLEWTPAGLPSYWNVMFRKSCLEEVGLLDESFKNFSSDHDHGMRILRAGWKIRHVLPFNLKHKISASVSKLPEEKELLKSERERFLKKWGLNQ